jgi:hypothetical protein
MINRYLIYGLVDPFSGQLRYIGRSSSGLKRPQNHAHPSRLNKDNSHSGAWIRKLKAVNSIYSVVVIQHFTDGAILDKAEIFWIKYFRSMGCPLTNLTEGGCGVSGWKHSSESRSKISQSNKGKSRKGHPMSAATKQKLILSNLGNKYTLGRIVSDEERQKLSALHKGNTHWLDKKHSNETKTKIKNALLGVKHTEERKKNIKEGIARAKFIKLNLASLEHESKEAINEILGVVENAVPTGKKK